MADSQDILRKLNELHKDVMILRNDPNTPMQEIDEICYHVEQAIFDAEELIAKENV